MLGNNTNPEDLGLFSYEDPCFLCKGFGRIAIAEKKRKTLPTSEECPMCKSKGFLQIEKGDLEL